MSTADRPAAPPAEYPEPTQADHDAMFASVVWFREKALPVLGEEYGGKHVAILGEQIIDSDRDKDELFRRLDAMGDALPPNRVVIQYVQTAEEAWRY